EPIRLPFEDEPQPDAKKGSGAFFEDSGEKDTRAGEKGTRPLFSDALPDADARTRAVDPAHNVVLEASAGTGKTYVLVERYLNLLKAGVDPANILAITFTRKAAAEMRGRLLSEMKKRADGSAADQQLWRDMRER